MNAALQQMREQKDNFYRLHPQSPLTPQQREKFDGLNYYPFNTDLRLLVEVDLVADEQQILMQTNTNELRPFFRHGTFEVTVDGETATLTIYRSPDGGHFFLPFVDAGGGTETYGAGRYLDVEPEDNSNKTFVVDFNVAYNPYCAYNERWVCPITPAENRIGVHIRAGEKLPTGDWAQSY